MFTNHLLSYTKPLKVDHLVINSFNNLFYLQCWADKQWMEIIINRSPFMLRHYGKSSLKWGPISVLKYYVKVKSLQVTKTLPCKHFKKSGAWILSKSSPGIIERCKHMLYQLKKIGRCKKRVEILVLILTELLLQTYINWNGWILKSVIYHV